MPKHGVPRISWDLVECEIEQMPEKFRVRPGTTRRVSQLGFRSRDEVLDLYEKQWMCEKSPAQHFHTSGHTRCGRDLRGPRRSLIVLATTGSLASTTHWFVASPPAIPFE
jgi:hypothetical protein